SVSFRGVGCESRTAVHAMGSGAAPSPGGRVPRSGRILQGHRILPGPGNLHPFPVSARPHVSPRAHAGGGRCLPAASEVRGDCRAGFRHIHSQMSTLAPSLHEEFMRTFFEAEPKIRAYALSCGLPAASVDDLAQDAALVLWRRFEEY